MKIICLLENMWMVCWKMIRIKIKYELDSLICHFAYREIFSAISLYQVFSLWNWEQDSHWFSFFFSFNFGKDRIECLNPGIVSKTYTSKFHMISHIAWSPMNVIYQTAIRIVLHRRYGRQTHAQLENNGLFFSFELYTHTRAPHIF